MLNKTFSIKKVLIPNKLHKYFNISLKILQYVKQKNSKIIDTFPKESIYSTLNHYAL